MEVSELLERMRDPLGAPFYPRVFQLLLLITWAIHILFVTMALGSSVISIYGFIKGGDYQTRLARSAAKLTPSAVGLGIVSGIAPLLFVQVIYDPIWYASNALAGFWSVAFVFVVIGGYSLAYLFYMKGSPDGRLLWSAVGSAALLAFAGWIMHVLSAVSIRPEEWTSWYAPGGEVDTSGLSFHAYQLPRLTFLLVLQAALSLAVAGLVYTWYQAKRPEADMDYLQWVANMARRLAMGTAVGFLLIGVMWSLTEGMTFDVALPMLVGSALVGGGLLALFGTMSEPVTSGLRAAFGWLGALIVVAVMREVVRTSALSAFDYSVGDYPYIVNWGSVALFGVTTVVGVSAVVYLLMVFYQSGLTEGPTQISLKVDRFGQVTTSLLGAWFGFFLLLGLYTVALS
jgi:hypothetical protein